MSPRRKSISRARRRSPGLTSRADVTSPQCRGLASRDAFLTTHDLETNHIEIFPILSIVFLCVDFDPDALRLGLWEEGKEREDDTREFYETIPTPLHEIALIYTAGRIHGSHHALSAREIWRIFMHGIIEWSTKQFGLNSSHLDMVAETKDKDAFFSWKATPMLLVILANTTCRPEGPLPLRTCF